MSIIAAFPADAIISTRAAASALQKNKNSKLLSTFTPSRVHEVIDPHLCSCDALAHLMGVMRVDNPGQPEVPDLEQELVCVDEYVGRFQVSVQDISGVDELQSPQQLVEQQRCVICLVTKRNKKQISGFAEMNIISR